MPGMELLPNADEAAAKVVQSAAQGEEGCCCTDVNSSMDLSQLTSTPW